MIRLKSLLFEAPQFDERVLKLDELLIGLWTESGQQLVISDKVTGERWNGYPVIEATVKPGTFNHDEKLAVSVKAVGTAVPNSNPLSLFKSYGDWEIYQDSPTETTGAYGEVLKVDRTYKGNKQEAAFFTAYKFIEIKQRRDDEFSSSSNYPAKDVYVVVPDSNLSVDETNQEGSFVIRLNVSKNTIRPERTAITAIK